MKFKTIQEAFLHYQNYKVEEIEKRASEIDSEVRTNAQADIQALNVEAEGLRQAKENTIEKRGKFNPLENMDFEADKHDDIYATKEYRTAFFKKMLNRELSPQETKAFDAAEKRTATFNTTGNSGSVIPTQTLNEVIKRAGNTRGAMEIVRKFEMPSYISIPVGNPTQKANWHVQGAEVEGEDAGTTSVKFEGNEIIKIFSISSAVETMSIPAFESYIVDQLVECVMDCIADSLINGTGSEQGTGILNGVTWDAVNSEELVLGFGYQDMVKGLGKLKKGYRNNAKYTMSSVTAYEHVLSMTDTTGRPLFAPDAITEGKLQFFGKEIVLDDNMPDNVMILGDWNLMGYNLPLGITIESSRQSSFKKGLIDYKAQCIADSKVILEEAFYKFTIKAA